MLWFLVLLLAGSANSALLTIGTGKNYSTLVAACAAQACNGSVEFVVDPGSYALPSFPSSTTQLKIQR
jgi:hypothetical protein